MDRPKNIITSLMMLIDVWQRRKAKLHLITGAFFDARTLCNGILMTAFVDDARTDCQTGTDKQPAIHSTCTDLKEN